jgi:hypothetical protein
MKILICLMMVLTLTSAMAGECKVDGDCKEDADCKALKADYSVVAGKCVKPNASETETQCAGIVNTSGAKGATDTKTGAAAGTNTAK